jgi:hypothetical protein
MVIDPQSKSVTFSDTCTHLLHVTDLRQQRFCESDVSGIFVCNVAEFDRVGIVYTLCVALQVV